MQKTAPVLIAILASDECVAQSAPAGSIRDLSAYKPNVLNPAAKAPNASAPALASPSSCNTTACMTKRIADLEALVAAQHEKIVLLEAALKDKAPIK
jgi:hypothetical protein